MIARIPSTEPVKFDPMLELAESKALPSINKKKKAKRNKTPKPDPLSEGRLVPRGTWVLDWYLDLRVGDLVLRVEESAIFQRRPQPPVNENVFLELGTSVLV